MINNVLYDPLPCWYGDYLVNMDFQVGIQVSQVFYDPELSDSEKNQIIIELLFGDENDEGEIIVRVYPADDFQNFINWYLSGWSNDNKTGSDDKRVMDYHKDQWRIYADFLRNYQVDLNTTEMHWWRFQGLLWNMTGDTSTLYNAIDIRTKKIGEKYSEQDANRKLRDAKLQLAIEEVIKAVKEYTEEEIASIDQFDEIMK